MKYSSIKGLSTPVSRIILGTMALNSEKQDFSNALLDEIYALGINTFDSALVYGNGCEVALGRWVASRGLHDQVNIITKGAHHSPYRRRVTPYDILSDCNESLARLGMETIDIYLLHRDDPSVPVSAIVDTLNRLYDAGKIRIFGVSNWTHERILQANEYADKYGLQPLTVSSPNYSLAEQVDDPWGGGCVTISGAENEAARAFYRQTQMPVFSYSSLGRNFFSGRISSSDPASAKKLLDQWAYRGYACPENFERLKRCEQLAEEFNLTVPQVAMAWLFGQPENVSAIVGVSTAAHMHDHIKALDISLTQQQMDYLNLTSEAI